MEVASIIVTVYLLFCGLIMLFLCKRSGHPLRTGVIGAAGGLLALGSVSLAGLAVPVNLYTAIAAAVLGIPGVAGLSALALL